MIRGEILAIMEILKQIMQWILIILINLMQVLISLSHQHFKMISIGIHQVIKKAKLNNLNLNLLKNRVKVIKSLNNNNNHNNNSNRNKKDFNLL
jgi:hypothetical protein